MLADVTTHATTIPAIAGRNGTRERLMAAAEQLVGVRGSDGVSLEEIARQAGQANKYAVQYHFGGRSELLQAILDIRIAQLDVRRRALMEDGAVEDVHRALTIFVMPLAEQVDEADGFSFARFLLQYSLRLTPWPAIAHPLASAGEGRATLELFGRLAGFLPDRTKADVGRRLQQLLQLPSYEGVRSSPGWRQPLDETIAMMAAAITA